MVLALLALAINVLMPFLSIWGLTNVGGQSSLTMFGLGYPARVLVAQLIGRWGTGLVILVGILLLRRLAPVTAGIFLAAALALSLDFVQWLSLTGIKTIGGTWVSALTAAQAVLLFLAAATLWGSARPVRPVENGSDSRREKVDVGPSEFGEPGNVATEGESR